MPEDARLDEFTAAGGAERAAGEDDRDGAPGDGGREAVAGDDGGSPTPDAPAVTYRFAPAGARCAACGTTADRLWRSEAGPVCPDCKAWEA